MQGIYSSKNDFSEIVLGDIPAPYRPILPDFEKLESNIDRVFEERFDLKGEYLLMKDVDHAVCKMEAKYLMRSKGKGEKWDSMTTIDLPVKRRELYGLEGPIYNEIVPVFKNYCKKYKVK